MILSEPQKISGRSISNVKQHLLKKLLLNSNVSPCNIYFKENEHKESTVLKFYDNLQFHFFHTENIYENCYIGIDLDLSKPKGMPLDLKLFTKVKVNPYITKHPEANKYRSFLLFIWFTICVTKQKNNIFIFLSLSSSINLFTLNQLKFVWYSSLPSQIANSLFHYSREHNQQVSDDKFLPVFSHMAICIGIEIH